MKNKAILSLVMAAAVTLGGAAMATNANFNATAVSNGNEIIMGRVQLESDNGQYGQSIDMGKLFSVNKLGTLTAPVSQTKTIYIRGDFPVTLSLGDLVQNPQYTQGGSEPQYVVSPQNIAQPTGVISTWWRHYKMATDIKVYDKDNKLAKNVAQGFDSFFDTINGTKHNGLPNTKGINDLLTEIGPVDPGSKVVITTTNKFDQTAYYTYNAKENIAKGGPARIDGDYTLTQDQVNAFQGQRLGINLRIIATEAK